MRYVRLGLILALFFLALHQLPLWVDPDATGTYNAICGNGKAEVLPLTENILSKLPCTILEWKIIQLFLIGFILLVFQYFFPLPLLGLVGFFPVFLLTLEDDLFAFPFLFSYFVLIQLASLKSNQLKEQLPQDRLGLFLKLGSVSERLGFRYKLFLLILGVALTLFLGLYVWKGSFLIGLILISYLIHPGLSVIPSLAYLVLGNFNTWGGSSEAALGNGFVIGQLGILLLLYFFSKKGFRWRQEYWLLISLEVLTFFQPKWGEWLILPLVMLLEDFMSDSRLRFFGYWMLGLIVLFTVFTSFPNQEEVVVIQEAVSYQQKGNRVLNDWGVGHYFEYYGGSPSQSGGFIGLQDANGSYWLGPKRDCNTLSSANALFFQSC